MFKQTKTLLIACLSITLVTACMAKPEIPQLKITAGHVSNETALSSSARVEKKPIVQTEVTFEDIPYKFVLNNSSRSTLKGTGQDYKIECKGRISFGCAVWISNEISYKPIEQVTGTATFTGSMVNHFGGCCNSRASWSRVAITLEVDFDDNTINSRNNSYGIRLKNVGSSIDIKATFDDRGGIKGKAIIHYANDNSQDCNRSTIRCYSLTGLIGQDKMVGVYASSSRYSHERGAVSGGFTANRVAE